MFILQLLVIMANNSLRLLSCNLMPDTTLSALHRLPACEGGSMSRPFCEASCHAVLSPTPTGTC